MCSDKTHFCIFSFLNCPEIRFQCWRDFASFQNASGFAFGSVCYSPNASFGRQAHCKQARKTQDLENSRIGPHQDFFSTDHHELPWHEASQKVELCKTSLDNGIHQWLQFPLTLETQRICEMPFDVIFAMVKYFRPRQNKKEGHNDSNLVYHQCNSFFYSNGREHYRLNYLEM